MTEKKRFYEIDFVRVILMLAIPLVHVYEYLGYQSQMSDILSDGAVAALNAPYVFFTGFGAPLFMVFMGMNMHFTKRISPLNYFTRGVILLLVEIGFNLIRYIIPGLIGAWICGIGNETGIAILFWMVYGLINSDIFALAGFSFILVALLKKLNFKPLHILITSVVMFAVDCICFPFIGARLAENIGPFTNELFGHIIYVNEDSIFPLMRWFIFIACGYFYVSCLQQKNIFLKTAAVSAVMTIAFFTYSILSGKTPFMALNVVENSNEMTPVMAFGEIAMAFFFMSILCLLYRGLIIGRFSKFNEFIKKFSSVLSYYYAMQWIIVGWIMFISCGCGVWGSKAITTLPCILLIIAIIVASYFAGVALQRFVKKHIV